MLYEDDIAVAIVQSDLDSLLAMLPDAEAQKVLNGACIKIIVPFSQSTPMQFIC